MTVEEPPHGANAHLYAEFQQQGLQLGQRHIRCPFHLVQKKASLRLDPPRAAVSALRLGANITALVPRLGPTDRAGTTYIKTRRRLSERRTSQHLESIQRLNENPQNLFSQCGKGSNMQRHEDWSRISESPCDL